MSSSNKQIVEKVNAAFAQGNVEGFLSQCADDVEWTMVGEKPIKGKDAIRKWMTSMGPEVPKFTVTNLLADGDFATCYGDMTMRDKDGKVIPVFLLRHLPVPEWEGCGATGLRDEERTSTRDGLSLRGPWTPGQTLASGPDTTIGRRQT